MEYNELPQEFVKEAESILRQYKEAKTAEERESIVLSIAEDADLCTIEHIMRLAIKEGR